MRKHSHETMRLREAAAPERRPAEAGLFSGRFNRGAAAASAAAFAHVAAATAAFAASATTILPVEPVMAAVAVEKQAPKNFAREEQALLDAKKSVDPLTQMGSQMSPYSTVFVG